MYVSFFVFLLLFFLVLLLFVFCIDGNSHTICTCNLHLSMNIISYFKSINRSLYHALMSCITKKTTLKSQRRGWHLLILGGGGWKLTLELCACMSHEKLVLSEEKVHVSRIVRNSVSIALSVSLGLFYMYLINTCTYTKGLNTSSYNLRGSHLKYNCHSTKYYYKKIR